MQLVFIFGAGIGSFIGPVTDILANEGVSMSKQEVGTLLLIACFCYITKGITRTNC